MGRVEGMGKKSVQRVTGAVRGAGGARRCPAPPRTHGDVAPPRPANRAHRVTPPSACCGAECGVGADVARRVHGDAHVRLRVPRPRDPIRSVRPRPPRRAQPPHTRYSLSRLNIRISSPPICTTQPAAPRPAACRPRARAPLRPRAGLGSCSSLASPPPRCASGCGCLSTVSGALLHSPCSFTLRSSTPPPAGCTPASTPRPHQPPPPPPPPRRTRPRRSGLRCRLCSATRRQWRRPRRPRPRRATTSWSASA